MELTLTDAQLDKILNTAILKAIDQEGRESIITQAVKYLTTPEPSKIGHKTEHTPLVKAFNRALDRCLDNMVRDFFHEENSKLKKAVRKHLEDAVEVFLTEQDSHEFGKLSQKISEAIREALTPDDRSW